MIPTMQTLIELEGDVLIVFPSRKRARMELSRFYTLIGGRLHLDKFQLFKGKTRWKFVSVNQFTDLFGTRWHTIRFVDVPYNPEWSVLLKE